MNALVVYDSQYGNTELIAEAIVNALKEYGQARAIRADRADADQLRSADVVILGCPTQGWRPTRSMQSLLAHVPADVWPEVSAVAFDTRFHWPRFLSGSAARGISKRVAQLGARLVAPAESFFVTGKTGPLQDGELERAGRWARAWARALHDKLEKTRT